MAPLIRCTGVLVLVAACVVCSGVRAQTLDAPPAPGGLQEPRWLWGWSPLAPVADLPRALPGAGPPPTALLTLPAPRVGAFWAAGNPAALPFELDDAFAQFRGDWKEAAGDYRRPLDPGSDRRFGASATGWRTLADGRAATIGRVLIERVEHDDEAQADVILPYSSNPFAVADTSGDALAGTVVRLEGAGGWRIGNLGLGLALGFEGREIRTVASTIPRLERVAVNGANAGAEYAPADWLRIGAFGRWRRRTQTIFITPDVGVTRTFVFGGFFEPVPLLITPTDPYHRRFVGEGWAVGGSLSGTAGGMKWTLYGQAEDVTEDQSTALRDEPPTDRWAAHGWRGGLALQARFDRNPPMLATLAIERMQLEGQAVRMDLTAPHFSAEESVLYSWAEVRVLGYGGWSGALAFALTREDRRGHDELPGATADLKQWEPAVSLEVGRALPLGFAIALGGSITQHAPWGSLPTPDKMGPIYQRYVAPALELQASEATATSGYATLRWTASDRTAIWLRALTAALSPVEAVERLPSRPSGSRQRTLIELGITVGEGER